MFPLQHVLLVDDSAEDNFVHQYLLTREGLAREVRVFSYAADALSYLRSPSRPAIDLVMVDLNMPRMNGFEFADAFVTLYPELKEKTKLIIVSASLAPEDEQHAKDHAGVDAFIQKPVCVERLRELLEA